MDNNEEISLIIKKSVKETLTGLGFDVREPREMQQDLLHLRKIRKGSEEISKKAKATMIALVVSTGTYMLWESIKKSIIGE